MLSGIDDEKSNTTETGRYGGWLRPGLAWCRSPTPPPSVRLVLNVSHSPVSPCFPSLTYTYTYIYIHKRAHPPLPRSIPFKPYLCGGDVAAHSLGDEALHTLQSEKNK
ncbi:hypothetical protein HanIR_Chr05g0250301 [Helianthus annuus]|nr:hypothetical protein HanIR_Chr05g0250301 [Helianthus annuus]